MAKAAAKRAGAKSTGATKRKATTTRRKAAPKAKAGTGPVARRSPADRAAQRLRVNKSRKRLGLTPIRPYEQVGRGRKPGTKVKPSTRMKQSLSMKRFWKSTLGRKRKMKCAGKRGCPYVGRANSVAKAIKKLRARRAGLYAKVKSGKLNIRGANEARKAKLENMKKTTGKKKTTAKRGRPAGSKNKPKAAPAAKRRGRPAGSKNKAKASAM